MKKEIKKLESWQDVLDVWVSKGAVFYTHIIQDANEYQNNTDVYYLDTNMGTMLENISIYEILYSPESNFFDVMFADGLDKEKTRGKRGIPTYSEIIKRETVLSKDPLQYLLDNLNETTR